MNLLAHPSEVDDVLALIWNNTTDAIFTIDKYGAVIDANPAFENMLGWNVEEIKGMSYPPFLANMSREEQQNLLKKLKNGENLPYEIGERKHMDGSMLGILASYWPVHNNRIHAIGMYKDFTEQMKIKRKLEESEYCYRTLVEHLPEVIIKQRHNKIELVNTSGKEFFGVNKLEHIINCSIWDFITSDNQDVIQHKIDTIYDQNPDKNPITHIDKFLRKDGKEIWAEVKIIPIGNKETADVQIVFSDITEKKKYESQLEYLAYHDPLTGLKNRRMFKRIATDAIQSAENIKGTIAMMYIDIDDFKLINDTYGHDVGDQLLQMFVKRLTSCVRESDVLCRVGGDEFLVLLNDISKQQDIIHIAERMLLVFQETYDIRGLALHITSSIGIAVYPKNGSNYDTLLRRADKALYRSKAKRNMYMFAN